MDFFKKLRWKRGETAGLCEDQRTRGDPVAEIGFTRSALVEILRKTPGLSTKELRRASEFSGGDVKKAMRAIEFERQGRDPDAERLAAIEATL